MDTRKAPKKVPKKAPNKVPKILKEYISEYNQLTVLYDITVIAFQEKLKNINSKTSNDKLHFYLETIKTANSLLGTIKKLDVKYKRMLKNEPKKIAKKSNKNTEFDSVIVENQKKTILQIYGISTILLITYVSLFDLEQFGTDYSYIKSAKEIADLCETIYAENKQIIEENHIDLAKDINKFYTKYVSDNTYAEIQKILAQSKSTNDFKEYSNLFQQAYELANIRDYIKEKIIICWEQGYHTLTCSNVLDNNNDNDKYFILYKTIESFTQTIQLILMLPANDDLLESIRTICENLCNELVKLANHLYEHQDNENIINDLTKRHEILKYALQCISNLKQLQTRLKKEEFIDQKAMEVEIQILISTIEQSQQVESTHSEQITSPLEKINQSDELYPIHQFFKPPLGHSKSLDSFFRLEDMSDRENKREAGGRPPLSRR